MFKAGTEYEVLLTTTGLKTWTTEFENEHLSLYPNWVSVRAVLWVLNCTIKMTICSYHFTYPFQSEPTFYSSVNVKELFLRCIREMWSLSYCKDIRTNSHLVRKQALNYSAKLAKRFIFALRNYRYGAFECIFL